MIEFRLSDSVPENEGVYAYYTKNKNIENNPDCEYYKDGLCIIENHVCDQQCEGEG